MDKGGCIVALILLLFITALVGFERARQALKREEGILQTMKDDFLRLRERLSNAVFIHAQGSDASQEKCFIPDAAALEVFLLGKEAAFRSGRCSYAASRLYAVCSAVDPCNQVGKIPHLADLRELTVQQEQGQFWIGLVRVIESVMLILGIFGTLFVIHTQMQEMNVKTGIAPLAQALVVTLCATVCMIVLMIARSYYHCQWMRFLKKLDTFTLQRLLPSYTFSSSLEKDVGTFCDLLNKRIHHLGAQMELATKNRSLCQSLECLCAHLGRMFDAMRSGMLKLTAAFNEFMEQHKYHVLQGQITVRLMSDLRAAYCCRATIMQQIAAHLGEMGDRVGEEFRHMGAFGAQDMDVKLAAQRERRYVVAQEKAISAMISVNGVMKDLDAGGMTILKSQLEKMLVQLQSLPDMAQQMRVWVESMRADADAALRTGGELLRVAAPLSDALSVLYGSLGRKQGQLEEDVQYATDFAGPKKEALRELRSMCVQAGVYPVGWRGILLRMFDFMMNARSMFARSPAWVMVLFAVLLLFLFFYIFSAMPMT